MNDFNAYALATSWRGRWSRGDGGGIQDEGDCELLMCLDLAFPGGSVHNDKAKGDPSRRLNRWRMKHLLSCHFCLKIVKTFFESMIPPEAIKRLFFKKNLSFFNLRGEQMLTDEISLVDSFVSDA